MVVVVVVVAVVVGVLLVRRKWLQVSGGIRVTYADRIKLIKQRFILCASFVLILSTEIIFFTST